MSDTHRFIRRASVPLLPAALTMMPEAEAQVVYTPDQNLQVSASDPASSRIFFDLDHSGAGPYAQFVGSNTAPAGADFSVGFGTMVEGDTDVANPGIGKVVATNTDDGAGIATVGSFSTYAIQFAEGDFISGDDSFSTGERRLFMDGITDSQWAEDDSGYVGLHLGDGYGWARLSIGEDSITLHDFAFNPDGAILAGTTTVPEPAVSAMLAAALAGGVAIFQRRRQKKTLSAEPVN